MSSNVSQMTWNAFFSGATEITQNTLLLATNPIIQSGFQNQDKQQVFNKELNKKHDLILMRKDHTFNKGKREFYWFFFAEDNVWHINISNSIYAKNWKSQHFCAAHKCVRMWSRNFHRMPIWKCKAFDIISFCRLQTKWIYNFTKLQKEWVEIGAASTTTIIVDCAVHTVNQGSSLKRTIKSTGALTASIQNYLFVLELENQHNKIYLHMILHIG